MMPRFGRSPCGGAAGPAVRPGAGRRVLMLALVLLFGPVHVARATSWAMLIGCEGYERAPRLRYIVNDVNALEAMLCERGDYFRHQVRCLHDESKIGRPTRETIEKTVKDFLARPAKGDRLIVYFSGHGFRDDEGRLYLAPLDCDPRDPKRTGVPVQWLREQVEACKADTKIVILDACHAGSERSAGPRMEADSAAVGEAFRDLDRVVTIASSAATQPSRLDPAHEHSLFTYWLIEGLKGTADSSRDGVVSVDELFGFVHHAVSQKSEALGGRQTPVRIVRPGVEGVPVAVKLVPQPLDTVLDDIAAQLAERISARGIERVGVLEFIDATEAGELLGVNYGLLGRWCAEALHDRLLRLGGDRYSMVHRRRLKAALASERFSVDGLADAGRMRSLSRSAGGMPAVVIGNLAGDVRLEGRDAGKAVVRVEARLAETEGSDEFARVAGIAYLNESDWAMAGGSGALRPEDHAPPREKFYEGRPEGLRPVASAVALVERLDARADKGHPLGDDTFPFPVRIMVKRGDTLVEQPGRMVNDEWVVTLAKGDQYVIRVASRHPERVFMRLLVDGLNTRAEKQPAGGSGTVSSGTAAASSTADDKGVTTLVAGMRVHLDSAQPWLLDPDAPGTYREQGIPIWDLHGFEKGELANGDTEFGAFTVVDSSSALAARRGFSEQIGTITAAFYTVRDANAPRLAARGAVGTDAGARIDRPVMTIKGLEVGPMLATVTIRYATDD